MHHFGRFAAGVAKFNVGTTLKRRFWDGLKTALDRTPADMDPHLVIGSRKPLDVMHEGKQRIKDEVIRRIHVYRSNNRALD